MRLAVVWMSPDAAQSVCQYNYGNVRGGLDATQNGATEAQGVILRLYGFSSLGIVQSRGNIHISDFVILFTDFH